MKTRRILSGFMLIVLASAMLLPATTALAQPSQTHWDSVQWHVPPDSFIDGTGEPGIGGGENYVDLVGTVAHPAVFHSFTDDYVYFRERVVGDPLKTTGQGIFENASWVALLYFDEYPGYDFLISLSGQDPEELVRLYWNNIPTRQVPFVYSPTNTDTAETELATFPAASYGKAQVDDTGSY